MITYFKKRFGSQARPSLAQDYLLFSALIILGLVLLCTLAAVIMHNAHQQQLETGLKSETLLVEHSFTGILNDVKNAADFIAEKANSIGFDKKETIARLFARSTTIDVEMQSISSWLVFEWVPAGEENPAYPLQQARKAPWQLHFADITTERDIQEYAVIPMAYGVMDEKGRYQGAIVARIPLAHLQRILDKNLVKANLSYLVLDANLEPLVVSKKESIPAAGILKETLRDAFDGTQLAANLPSAIKKDNVSYRYFQKSSYPFLIISGYDEALLASQFRQEIEPYLALSAALGLFFLSVLYVFRRYTIAPVIHLANVATQIHFGMRRIEVREFGRGGRQKRRYPPEIHILRVALLRNIRDKARDRHTQQLLNDANLDMAKKGMELNAMKMELERVLSLSEESDKIKEKVIARIRYNTRNALNNIPIITQLLIRNLRNELDMHLTPEKQEQLLKILEEQAEHIAAFTTDDLHKVEIEPIALLKECIAFHAKQAHKRGVNLSLSKAKKLPKIRADRDRLTQIIVGLIYRSMDFLPRGGNVVIQAKLAEKEGRKQLVIAIKDDGFGWSEEERQHALSQHDDANLSRNVDGMDLSVHSVRKLVMLHSGHVEFTDVWEKGSTITLTLPYTQPGELVEAPALPENVISLSAAKEKKK